MTSEELKPIVEAIIFVSAEEPITFKQLSDIFEEEAETDLRAALDTLEREYEGGERGFQLRRVAGGYRFSTRPDHSEYIRRFRRAQPSAKLSIAALETL